MSPLPPIPGPVRLTIRVVAIFVVGSILWGVLACTSPGTAIGPSHGGAASTVAVSPADTDLAIGGTLSLAAHIVDSSGQTATPDTVVWSSSDTTVARVTRGGAVTGVGPGIIRISATVHGQTGHGVVGVIP